MSIKVICRVNKNAIQILSVCTPSEQRPPSRKPQNTLFIDKRTYSEVTWIIIIEEFWNGLYLQGGLISGVVKFENKIFTSFSVGVRGRVV